MGAPVKYIIFTDASRRTGFSNRQYCGYGVAVLNLETHNYITFGGELSDRSVVFCEAWAIYRGLVKVTELIDKDKSTRVLVVTDSKLNVDILSRWIPYAWDLSDWKHWRKSDGTLVKNQDLYRRIILFMKDHPELRASITHMNSHLGDQDWPKVKKKLQMYRVNVERETAQMFMFMNGVVDQIAQNITTAMRDRENRDGFYFRLKRKDDEDG